MVADNTDNIPVTAESLLDLSGEPDAASLAEANSARSTIDAPADGSAGCVPDTRNSVPPAVSGELISPISGTSNVQGRSPSPALWDVVVNFDAGDFIMICGPDFNVTFSSNQGAGAYIGLTMLATAPGSPSVSVTLSGQSIAALDEDARLAIFGGNPSNGHSDRYSYAMREPGNQYITVSKAIRRVIVPSGITLTPRVLLGALQKMPTPYIEDAIEHLLTELDARCGGSDDEPEPVEDTE